MTIRDLLKICFALWLSGYGMRILKFWSYMYCSQLTLSLRRRWLKVMLLSWKMRGSLHASWLSGLRPSCEKPDSRHKLAYGLET